MPRGELSEAQRVYILA